MSDPLRDIRCTISNALADIIKSHGYDSKEYIEALIQSTAAAVISMDGDTAGNIEWSFQVLYDTYDAYGFIDDSVEERMEN